VVEIEGKCCRRGRARKRGRREESIEERKEEEEVGWKFDQGGAILISSPKCDWVFA